MLKCLKEMKKGDSKMEVEWTEEQKSAFNTRDKTLLVSAAAGSGKTATLTERIIRSLTDKKKPLDIDSILVVTYTTTAAGELRTKISRALNKAIEKNPQNDHLKKQLYLLPAAKIRTIDSFCNEILRSNCDRVGVSPGFRIADTAECELLATSIIEGLIEAVYNGELPEIASPSEFEELCDCLTDSRKVEELSGVFRAIHLKCENAENGVGMLGQLIENYNCAHIPLEQTLHCSYLIEKYHMMLEHYITGYERYFRIFYDGSDDEKLFLDIIQSDKNVLLRLRAAEGYEEIRAAIHSYAFEQRPDLPKDAGEEIQRFVLFREMMKKELIQFKAKFEYTSEEWRRLHSELYRLTSVFYRFVSKFDELFKEEKRRHNAFAYSDVLRYTYECLVQNGEPTDIAKNVAAQYDAVYIDEYQDVNALQNRIFEAISRPNNRFMVGDIKQSIYVFRAARPDIFASMKKAFPPLKEATGDCASIFMSSNFRCDKGVVDFVNNIFDRAFNFVAESIGYVDDDRLKHAKKYDKIKEKPLYRYPTVCVVDKDVDEENGAPDLVARKIKELHENGRLNDGSEIKYSDIAIILKEARGRDSKYAAALEKYGIPSAISGSKKFFLCREVLLTLCLLNTIDNPRRDIYLAGLLKSPLFDFSADDLLLISRQEGESLYESLVSYVFEHPEFTKGASFLKTLEYYRSIAEGIGVDTLIYKLYRETGLMALASKNGGKENLTLLYDYARSYEAGAFKGLYNFINFINEIINKKTNFDDARTVAGVDAVKIVTGHKSKGLEYPIVFAVEANSLIYNKERTSRLAYSDDFGMSFLLRSPSGLALVDNPVHRLIQDKVTEKIYEESLRVLYVTLTRARERLYVVGKCPLKNRDEFERRIGVLRDNLTEHSFRQLSCYQDIILTCDGRAAVDQDAFILPDEEVPPKKPENTDGEADGNQDSLDPDKNADEEAKEEETLTPEQLHDELLRRFNFKYPNAPLTVLPEKMSVSLMSPTVLDGSEFDSVWRADRPLEAEIIIDPGEPHEEEGEGGEVTEEKKRTLPAFATGTSADESAKRGIATHLFMQFCDPKKLLEDGAEAELERLGENKFISSLDADRVRIDEIELFRRSKLLSRMLSAKKIYRELRFNVYLDASHFTEDERKKEAYRGKQILVQGVIDCIICGEDGSVLLCDYKTDRLTKWELANPRLAAKKLSEKHSMQLGLYSLAVEKIFGKAPDEVKIYSLPLGDTVDII